MSKCQTYTSTRASDNSFLGFEDAVLKGLASDGGLFLPREIPSVSSDDIESWADLSFNEVAFKVLSLYISRDEIPENDLKKLIEKSFSTFRSKDVTPLETLNSDKNLHVLELFHGPTYAFKDVALQFVGNLFEYFLVRKNQGKAEDDPSRAKVTVVGATSGDTGSAAIYGLRNKKDVSVFILYPTGRVSPIQEQQMTTVLDKNVHTISVKGTFDDCQDLVKQVFGDDQFNSKYSVGAVNSINWSRILVQMTYYFYAYFQLRKKTGSKSPKVKFVVPTGNFGDILAGFYAHRMGLPVESLVIATNANDILYRFFQNGSYSKAASDSEGPVVHATLSPAMDILVSSNFERFLWIAARGTVASSDGEAGKLVGEWMNELKTNGSFKVPAPVYELANKEFTSERTSDEQTIDTINHVYTTVAPKYILDPHSAVAVSSALRLQEKENGDTQFVALSTAHPAKFSDAVDSALRGQEGYSFEDDVLPQEFKDMIKKETKKLFADRPDIEVIKSIIVEELEKEKN